MKKTNIPKVLNIFLISVLNYILVLFGLVFYRGGAPLITLFFILTQAALTVMNCLTAKNIPELIWYSVNLLVSTIIGNILSSQLYYHNISSDSRTLLVGKVMLQIGIVYVIAISVIAIIIKVIYKIIKKVIKRNQT